MNNRFLRLALVSLLIVLVATACLPGKAVKGTEQEATLAYVEPIVDHILNGIEQDDYALFSRDFNDQMKEGIPEASFEDLREMLSNKIGSYQSREISSVRDVEGNILAIYIAVYSNAKEVVIQVSVTSSDPHQVTGLYFTSPELRK